MDKKEIESNFVFILDELEKQDSKFEKIKIRLKEIESKFEKLNQTLNRKNLTQEQRQEIKESNESIEELAIRFNRTKQQIYNIRNKTK